MVRRYKEMPQLSRQGKAKNMLTKYPQSEEKIRLSRLFIYRIGGKGKMRFV